MKKIFLLLIISIMLTGCSIEYNLNIENDELSEETNFIISISEYQNNEKISSIYDYPYSIYINEFVAEEDGISTNEDFTYYNKTISNDSNNYNITYKATYQKSNYKDSRFLNTAFTSNNINLTGTTKSLIARDLVLLNNYKSYNIESLTINIKMDNDYEVTNHNANSVNNNVYTWKFYNDNETNQDIILEFTKKKDTTNQNTDSTANNNQSSQLNNTNILSNYTIYIFLLILVTLIIIGYKLFNKMKERNNQIDD